MPKEIALSKGHVALVDDEAYEFLNQWKWYLVVPTASKTFYAIRRPRLPNGKNGKVYMHHCILPKMAGLHVDHVDRNGLNNCRANLRYATISQSIINRDLRRTKSPYRGVHQQTTGTWQAHIRIGGRLTGLGTYKTPEEAAAVYDAKARELHGAFAVLNFPDKAA